MRVGSFAVARPMYWDRNPTSNNANGNSGAVGPHGEGARWSVTIASGKKAFVDAACLETLRYTVASVNNVYYAAIRFTPSGGSACSIVQIQSFDNAVGSANRQSLAGSLLALAGDVISAVDADTGTGGTVNYSPQMHYILFDA
jgi:hypothetical protein